MNKNCGAGPELHHADWMVAVSPADAGAFISDKCKLIWQSLQSSLSFQIITVNNTDSNAHYFTLYIYASTLCYLREHAY